MTVFNVNVYAPGILCDSHTQMIEPHKEMTERKDR